MAGRARAIPEATRSGSGHLPTHRSPPPCTRVNTVRGASFSGSGLKITPTDNIEVLIANGKDPLFIKSARTDAIYGLVQLMGEAYESAPRLTS